MTKSGELRGASVHSLRSGIAVGSLAISLAIGALPGVAFAQNTQASDEGAAKDEIVVTGTLIRGQAPTGSELKAVNSADIAQLGVVNTSQLLGSIPADANFNSRPQVGGFGQYQTVNAPILRYLGGNAAASNSTLLLLNGHRLPGMGVLQTSSDIDAIAPGALERVDLVPDGGSATYGADAVGGVVNLITRKRYDGLELGGHFGAADSYHQWDVNVLAGKTFGAASLWVTYNYAENSLLRARDRDYVRNLDYTASPPVPASLNCSPGNYEVGGLIFTNTPPFFAFIPTTDYPIINGAVNTSLPANRCDTSRQGTILPASKRHSAMAGLNVELSDAITFDVTAFYTHRSGYNVSGASPYTVNYAAGGGLPAGKVYGTFAPTFGPENYSARTSLSTWGVTPQFTVKLGKDWRFVAFYNYGEGYAEFGSTSINQALLQTQTDAGAFNPLTGLFASTPAGQAALAYQSNYRALSSGKDTISNARAVIDGPLFGLPAGQVRVALGGEILTETYVQRNGTALASDLGSILPNRDSRTVKSVFGEISIPLFSDDNATPGFQSLTLSAAGRYDHYSDFGGTFNPKFGVTWKPASWWTIRGNWGTSYQAPSPASKATIVPPGLQVFPANTFQAPGDTAGKFIILLYPGGGIGLRPQKATTWQIGTDIRPDAIPGLSASLSYYKIDFKDRIAFPSFFSPSFYTLYPDSYVLQNAAGNAIDATRIQQYISSVPQSVRDATTVSALIADPTKLYALENGLSQNLQRLKTSGLDFSIEYKKTTGFGSIFAGIAGTYILSYQSQSTPTGAFQGIDANSVPRWRTAATLGANVGDVLGQLTWNRTGGFAVQPTAINLNQSRVDSFNVFNLALQYSPKWSGALEGVSINLNVDNIFDTDPPNYYGANGNAFGYAGFTIGRFVQLGVKKKF